MYLRQDKRKQNNIFTLTIEIFRRRYELIVLKVLSYFEDSRMNEKILKRLLNVTDFKEDKSFWIKLAPLSKNWTRFQLKLISTNPTENVQS